MSTEGIYVCVRARPLNERELRSAQPGKGWIIDPYANTIQQDVPGKQAMNFDRVFDEASDNDHVYEDAAKRIVKAGLEGINGTIFAYGQTSSGKTYSMGSIMKKGFHDIFSHIKKDKERTYSVKATYVEIYNENISDLLDPSKTNLKIQDSKAGPFIVDLTETDVVNVNQALALHEQGSNARHVGSTLMNDQSSRSHTIFQLIVTSEPNKSASEKDLKNVRGVLKATINFVDLAGSERANSTGAQGQRLKEGAHINKSLLTLGAVIRKLAEYAATNTKGHVPFRDSRLTRILQPALGGNSRTTMLCCVTQSAQHLEETMGTLGFARRAKLIKNKIGVNETLDDKILIVKLKDELKTLKMKFNKLNSALSASSSDDNIIAAFKASLDCEGDGEGDGDIDDRIVKRIRLAQYDDDDANNMVHINSTSVFKSQTIDSFLDNHITFQLKGVDSAVGDADEEDEEVLDKVIVANNRNVKRYLLGSGYDSDADDDEDDIYFARPTHTSEFDYEDQMSDSEGGDESDVEYNDVLVCEGLPLSEEILEQIELDSQTLQTLSVKALRKRLVDMTRRIYELSERCDVLQSDLDHSLDETEADRASSEDVIKYITTELVQAHNMYGELIEDLRHDLEDLLDENDKLKKDKKTLKLGYKELNEEIEEVLLDKEALQEEIERLTKEISRSADEVKSLESLLECEREHNASMAGNKDDISTRLNTVIDERNDLQKELNLLNTKMNALNRELAESQDEYLKNQMLISDLRTEIKEGKYLTEQLRHDLTRAQEASSKSTSQFTDANAHIQSMETTLASERALTSSLQSEIDELKTYSLEIRNKADEQRLRDKERWDTREADLLAEIDQLVERVEEAEAVAADLHADFKSKIKEKNELLQTYAAQTDAERETLIASIEAKQDGELEIQRNMYTKLMEDGKNLKKTLLEQIEELSEALLDKEEEFERKSKLLVEERDELLLLCDDIEDRLKKERETRGKIESEFESARLEAASLRAVLAEVRSTSDKDEAAIERRISSITADKDRMIESMERRLQSTEDKNYRSERLLEESRSDLSDLRLEVQKLKTTIITLTAKKDEAEAHSLSLTAEIDSIRDELAAEYRKKMNEMRIEAEVARDVALQERDSLFEEKLDQVRTKFKGELERGLGDMRRREETLLIQLESKIEDYDNLQEKYANIKRNAQEEVLRQLDIHKQEWNKSMNNAIKSETKRVDEQRMLVAELRDDNDDLQRKLREVEKQLSLKEDTMQERMTSLQAKQEAFMTEKVAKYKVQMKKQADAIRVLQQNEVSHTMEVERTKTELERLKVKYESVSRELRDRDDEVNRHKDTISELERRQMSSKASATLTRSRIRDQLSLDDDNDGMTESIKPIRRSTRNRPTSLDDGDDLTSKMSSKPGLSSRGNTDAPVMRSALKTSSSSSRPLKEPRAVRAAATAYVYKKSINEDLDNTMAFNDLLDFNK